MSARTVSGLPIASNAGPGVTAHSGRGGRLPSPRAAALATDGGASAHGGPAARSSSASSARSSQAQEAAAPSTAPPLTMTLAACAVTALAFSPDRGTLTWGDDVGRMAIWDLSRLLKVLKQAQRKEQPPPPPPPPSKPGQADEEGGGRGGMNGWLAMRLHGLEVQMVHDWQAHSDSISSLQALAEPAAVFSCSADRHAKVWRHDGAACFGTLRRRRRPDEEDDRWSFPVDDLAHRKQMMEQAAVISQHLESEVFRSRQQSLYTPPASESSFGDATPPNQDPDWVYEPGAGAELCADVWRRLRSRRDAAAEPEPDGATFLTAQPGDEATGGEEAEAGAVAADAALEVGGKGAEAATAALIEVAEGAQVAGAVGPAEVAQVAKAAKTTAMAEVSAAAEAPDTAEAGRGNGDAAAPSAPRPSLYIPPARTFAEGTRVDSVTAARLDNALAETYRK